MALMGIDVGTTGVKCTIFYEDGKPSSQSYREYPTLHPQPGWFELNPEEVWNAVKTVIIQAVRQHQGDDIEAIGISSFGESAIPLSRKGQVLGNSLLYTDIRGKNECKKIEELINRETLMNLTGLPAHPMYTLCKMLWIRKHMADIYHQTWKFMLFEDFIIYRLTGIPCIDYSLASRTMAFNVTEKCWEARILDQMDMESNLFSAALPSGTVVGPLLISIAQELGLPSNVKVATGGHDQVCAAVGAGILQEGMAMNGMGTVDCITPTFSKPLINREMKLNHYACVPHAQENMYVTYAFNFTGGSLLKWYRDNFSLWEKTEAIRTGDSVYALLDRKAGDQPTDLLVLPHFAGSGTPHMDIGSKGAILGLSFDTTSSQIYRGLLEGVTYEMMYNLECLEKLGIPIHQLIAVGGGSKSGRWLQIKADIFNKTISTLDGEEAGTAGAAMLAGIAIGKYSSLLEAANHFVKIKKSYQPNPEIHAIYAQRYRQYKKIHQALKFIKEI